VLAIVSEFENRGGVGLQKAKKLLRRDGLYPHCVADLLQTPPIRFEELV
jgi:hypothetical protein